MDELTPKQRAFIKEYAVDMNGTQAAIRAGYAKSGASVQGARLLANAKVQAALKEEMGARFKKAELEAEDVIAQLAKIAFHDVRDVVNWDPTGVYVKNDDDVDGTIIAQVTQSINERGDVVVNVKTNDRMKALELLGKRFGLFTDKVQMSGDVEIKLELPDDIEEA